MTVVNFVVPKTLDNRIMSFIRTKGYSSKSEFFRVAAISFLEKDTDANIFEKDDDIEMLTSKLSKALSKEKNKKYINVRDQLKI